MIEALSHQREFELSDESATLALGGLVAGKAQAPQVIFLRGDLGAGKTTFARGFLRGYGFHGAVKSPTYTLVEPYEFEQCSIFHFDLYRLGMPEEAVYLGIEEYFREETICLVEWPERGRGWLPLPDITITLSLSGTGREFSWRGHTPKGRKAAERLWEFRRNL